MNAFRSIRPEDLNQNAFQMIGKDWMLVTAESGGNVNTMTASWGGLGVIWNKNVAYVVIRPQRFTKVFVDASETFSLTFFTEAHRSTLSYLGTVSGRDEDKVKKSGLSLRHHEGTPYFDEASVVLRCRKLFSQPLSPDSFIETELIEKQYPQNDFHTLYIAEITDVLIRE